jgi:hypothetical protein
MKHVQILENLNQTYINSVNSVGKRKYSPGDIHSETGNPARLPANAGCSAMGAHKLK